MNIILDIKPLSVNEAWKGVRYKTDKYLSYQKIMLYKLKAGKFPDPPFFIRYTFGLSNMAADIDNPVKPITDILQKKYGFNDKDIYKMELNKVKTEKGKEFISIFVETLQNQYISGTKKT